ncbi:MAG: DinB family protein [Acidobacteriota bacterium]|nr:DinB family protein [Acidobacteriota bacterium]
MNDFRARYIDEAFRSFRGHKRLADGAIAQLSDEQFFATPDPESNSVALIMKHLAGNMRSRFANFLTTDGEKPDRNRDREFVMHADAKREEVLASWEKYWQLVFDTLNSLHPGDLDRTVTIRGEPHSVLQAINRQVAHYAYHVGQIVFLAKHWKGAQWKTLSVPKGQSEQVNAELLKKQKKQS